MFVSGVGLTKVDEHWEKSLTELMAEAGLAAVESAGLYSVDAVVVSNVFAESLQEQVNLGAYFAEVLGLRGIACLRVEAGGASGLAAVYSAASSIGSGLNKAVLVVGAEKMSDATAEEAVALSSMEETAEYIASLGVSQLAEAALIYKEYLKRYGLEQEDVAYFSVLGHDHAQTAPHAQYQFKISVDTVMNSPYVAEPLRRLETTSPADGAAAVLLLSEDVAKKLDSRKAVLKGLGMASDYLSPFDREDPVEMRSITFAAQRALEMAGLSRNSIDFVEVHDSYSFMAPLSLEAMGFAEKGYACHEARKGRWSLSGEIPLNTFGGLKGRGNPVGASNIYSLAEAYLQVTGNAGKNQVDGAKAGLIQAVAGLGSHAAAVVVTEVG
ncbi:MAG: thiolase domain-containing protein [Candidatus Caldarchaeum sp.]|nr:thiolase domain-containing protein [Candidatus Caldarchaeum sp.]